MRLFHCNGCNSDVEQADNESLIIHICGSGDVDRICPVCRIKYAYTEQDHCLHCRAAKLAKNVASGKIGLVDAILEM